MVAALTLDALPDDAFQQAVVACGKTGRRRRGVRAAAPRLRLACHGSTVALGTS